MAKIFFYAIVEYSSLSLYVKNCIFCEGVPEFDSINIVNLTWPRLFCFVGM